MPATDPELLSIWTLANDAVVTVDADASLAAAATAMADSDVGLVVVTGPGVLLGVLSERDVVRAVAEGVDPAATPVSQLAHREVVWCEPDATVAEVAEEMMEEYVRHVLVEQDGQLTGIVSARDLLGAYVSAGQVDHGIWAEPDRASGPRPGGQGASLPSHPPGLLQRHG